MELFYLFLFSQDRTIAAAGLDVMTPEPLPPNDPLMSCPYVTVTPHMGSKTWETRLAMGKLAVANIIAGLEGKPMPAPIC